MADIVQHRVEDIADGCGCRVGQRGRPRDEEKNQAILEAASKLFLECGCDATSMDQVARCAGVSKQTVYSHFESKEALFAAAVSMKINAYRPQDALEKVSEHSLEADLAAVCENYMCLLTDQEGIDMFRLLASSAAKGGQLAQTFWQAGPAQIMAELVDFLGEQCKAGTLVIPDLEKAAVQLISLLKGRLHFQLAIGLIDSISDEERRAHVRDCVDMFLGYYGKK